MTVRQEVACRSYLPSRESVGVFSLYRKFRFLEEQKRTHVHRTYVR